MSYFRVYIINVKKKKKPTKKKPNKKQKKILQIEIFNHNPMVSKNLIPSINMP